MRMSLIRWAHSLSRSNIARLLSDLISFKVNAPCRGDQRREATDKACRFRIDRRDMFLIGSTSNGRRRTNHHRERFWAGRNHETARGRGEGQRPDGICPCRSRCRCGRSQPAAAADRPFDLRQCQRRHAADAVGADHRHRSAAQGAGLAGSIRHDMAVLQRSRFSRAPSRAWRAGQGRRCHHHRGVECDRDQGNHAPVRTTTQATRNPTPPAGSKRPVKLVTAAILCFAGVYAEAAEIHDGDTGYIAKNSIWFTDESDLSVWKRVRQTFAPKDVKTYQQIILEERQASQFSGPIKVKVISYWANQHEIHVKMLTEGRLADSEWWVEDKDYSNAAR